MNKLMEHIFRHLWAIPGVKEVQITGNAEKVVWLVETDDGKDYKVSLEKVENE
jgi:hypothetical protein